MKLNLLILVVIFFDGKVCLFLFYAVKGTQKQNFVSGRTENVVKSGPAPGVTSLNIGRKKENSKCFFSETGRRRALIFGILHFLVDFYKVCSYDAPGVKSGSAPVVTCSNIGKKTSKFFFSENGWHRALIFGM